MKFAIYCYHRHCTFSSRVAGTSHDLDRDYSEELTDDVFVWGEGTESELIQQAVERLLVRKDTRAGGAGDSFEWACCRNVLDYLGADPDITYNPETRAYSVLCRDKS